MNPSITELGQALQKGLVVYGELYAAAYQQRTETIELNHFEPHEFGMWWPFMETEHLQKIDRFRDVLGAKVQVSPAEDSLGRLSNKSSQHYPSPLVKAGDYMLPESSLEDGFRVACEVGFTGIGVYPDWVPHHGMHLDVRLDHPPGRPAVWSARTIIEMVDGKPKRKQVYGDIADVIKDWEQWIR